MAVFNVVKDYDWTSVPRGSRMRENAPRVMVYSYKIKSSESLNRLQNYVNIAAQKDASQFYNELYKNAEKEDTFIIPFFGDNVRSFSNEYGDTFQSAFLGSADSALMGAAKLYGELGTYAPTQMGTNMVRGIASDISEGKNMNEMVANVQKQYGKEYSSAPGSYIETPKLYQYAQNDAGLEISFPLFNTVNSDFQSKNTKLMEHLTRINRPTRQNSILMEPPRIYRVILVGVRHIKWAYCSSFSVNFLGTKRMISNKIIPEGYQISMTMTSLTTEVSNFMDNINS